MRKYENSLLAALFTVPSPAFDPFAEEFVLPQAYVSSDAFAVILDFLRTDEWLPFQSRELFDAVTASCRLLGIPATPKLQPLPPLAHSEAWIHRSVSVKGPKCGGVYAMSDEVRQLGAQGFCVVVQLSSAAAHRDHTETPTMQPTWATNLESAGVGHIKSAVDDLQIVFARREIPKTHLRYLASLCDEDIPLHWVNALLYIR